MIIIEDTRQKVGQHQLKLDYFKEQGIIVHHQKLDTGDYARGIIIDGKIILDETSTLIDTKRDLLEIAPSICGKQHQRFKAECLRAFNKNAKLIILIEEPLSLDTLSLWKSPVHLYGKFKGHPYTNVKGETLAKAMASMTSRYGVEFIFCDRTESGKKIVEILAKNN